MTRSTHYVGTIRAFNGDDMFVLKGIRRAVAVMNRNSLTNGLSEQPPPRWRVELKGRLGRNSPFAALYKRRGRLRVKLKHCARADIYIYRR